MTAKEANLMASKNEINISSILDKIKISAAEGKYVLFGEGGLTDLQYSQLKNLGYTVAIAPQDDFYIIRW